MTAPLPRPSRLLTVLRALWLLLAAGMLVVYTRGLLGLLSQPFNLCFELTNCTAAQAEAYVRQMGLDPGLINALVVTSVNIVVPLSCAGVAGFIMWRGGRTALALATATCLLVYGLVVGSDFVSDGLGPHPFAAELHTLALMVFVDTLLFALHTFPNGRFVPRWGVWLVAGEWLVVGAVAVTVGLDGEAAALALLVFTVLGLALQVYRFRRAAGPVEQQQLKWGLTGLLGFALNGLLWLTWVTPALTLGAPGLAVFLTFLPLSMVLVLSLPIMLAIAMLRYRLWDIDVLIRRTLIYTAVTAVLTATYFGLVVVLQAAAGQLTGQANSALATVLSTLAIAALFAPLRRRVQNFVDRRFYRRKYDTAQTLAAFAVQARDEVNLDQLSADLHAAVDEAMQPAHIGLWLRP